MKPEERARLLKFHAEDCARMLRTGREWILRREMVEYCVNDVIILRRSGIEFRRRYMDIADVDPFLVASTIASLAMHVYRKKFLQSNMLLNVPEGGFRLCQNQSVEALRYMKLFELQNDVQVQTSQWSVGEAYFPDGSERRMDGFVDRGPNRSPLAIEYLG